MADPLPPMDMPPPLTGWSRAVFRGKVGPPPKTEVRDAQDAVVYRVRGHLIGVPKRMTISTVHGVQVAELEAKMLSPVKNQSTLTMSDGGTWQVQGTLLE